jgi:hypothetical protein
MRIHLIASTHARGIAVALCSPVFGALNSFTLQANEALAVLGGAISFGVGIEVFSGEKICLKDVLAFGYVPLLIGHIVYLWILVSRC